MVRQRHQLDGHEFEQTLRDSGEERSLASCSPWDHRVRHDFATEQQQSLPGKHQIAFSRFPFIYPHIVPQHTHFFHSHPTSFAHSPKLHLGWTNYLSLQTRIVLRVKFNSVQLLSPVPLFATLWTASHQASLSITNSRSLLKLMSIESVMPSNHLIPCHPFFLPSIFPSISVFSNESVLCIRWSKYWNFSFSISPSNEYSGLMSFRMDWLDLLAVQGTLKRSSPTPQFKSINSLALSFLYSSTLISFLDYWKNQSYDQMDLCWQSNVSAFQYAVQAGHNFSSEEQASFSFMPAVTICSDFGV